MNHMKYINLVSQSILGALPGICSWKEVIDEKDRKQEI